MLLTGISHTWTVTLTLILWATSSRIIGITCLFVFFFFFFPYIHRHEPRLLALGARGRLWTSWQKWHAIKSTALNLILHDVTMEFRIRTQTKTARLMSRKSSSNRGIFIKNTQTIMKFSSEWIKEHLCLRWEPSQWVYLFVFDHIASLLQCAVNKLVQPGAGSPARLVVLHEKQEHVCNVKCEFRKPIL